MDKPFAIVSRLKLIWLLLAAIIVITQHGCNSEKRVTKALMKLDQKDLNKVRPWPNNYTYGEYTQMLDHAKIRQEFYRKRELQAKIAGDKKTEKTMGNNVKEYQKTIDRLENDTEFYKIYKIRQREIQVKIKTEQHIQKDLKKQKAKVDRDAIKHKKEIAKQREELIKDRKKRLDEKKGRLEDQKKEYLSDNKFNNQLLKQKRKELDQLQKVAFESGNPDDPTFVEGINTLTAEIQELENKQHNIENHLDSISMVIEDFIKDNYTPKDSIVEAQMFLSTDPIPLREKETIEALPDTMKINTPE